MSQQLPSETPKDISQVLFLNVIAVATEERQTNGGIAIASIGDSVNDRGASSTVSDKETYQIPQDRLSGTH